MCSSNRNCLRRFRKHSHSMQLKKICWTSLSTWKDWKRYVKVERVRWLHLSHNAKLPRRTSTRKWWKTRKYLILQISKWHKLNILFRILEFCMARKLEIAIQLEFLRIRVKRKFRNTQIGQYRMRLAIQVSRFEFWILMQTLSLTMK